MNIDNIHDALGLLDDDMIEAVDKLRNEKMQSKKGHSKVPWVRWISVAACLSFIVISVYAIGSNDSHIAESDSVQEDASGEEKSEDYSTNDNIAQGELVELPSVLVEIESWQEDGFTGTIAGIVDTEIYGVGTKVDVKFNGMIYIGETIENGMQYKEGIPDSTDFPVGSVVCVQFYKSETERGVEDTESDIVILYIGQIAPAETE